MRCMWKYSENGSLILSDVFFSIYLYTWLFQKDEMAFNKTKFIKTRRGSYKSSNWCGPTTEILPESLEEEENTIKHKLSQDSE